ncbi:MAG: polyprenyl synthetase family protein [Vicinamibacterales bacterium]
MVDWTRPVDAVASSPATPTSPMSFATYARDHRRVIDAALSAQLPTPPACPAPLAEAMAYAVCGGKRFRPLLVIAAAEAVGQAVGTDRRADPARLVLPAACAIEFVHAQSLVHDDLPAMDNDTLRRGAPTVHVRYGEALAILAGDALLSEAFGVLARAARAAADDTTRERWLRVAAELDAAVGASGMAGGQALDLLYAATPGQAVTLAALDDMHRRKTGALIRAAAVSGAMLAGGSAAQVAAVAGFADDIGLAFQIVDDLLDVEASSAELGKTAGKDAAGGKPTYPSLVGTTMAREMAADAVARAHAALAAARLDSRRLSELATWVLTRRC